MLTPDVVALIDVQLPSGRRRQYSLCGAPGRRTDYRIAVRRIADGGGGSIEMHDVFDVGDSLVFEGPRNAFYLGSHQHDLLFVIGGIGVTPILPMLRAAAARGIDWHAVYAGSNVGGAGAGDRVGRRRARPIRHRSGAACRRRTHDGGLRVWPDRPVGFGPHGA
jgi:ferredoxin-NADP reductase